MKWTQILIAVFLLWSIVSLHVGLQFCRHCRIKAKAWKSWPRFSTTSTTSRTAPLGWSARSTWLNAPLLWVIPWWRRSINWTRYVFSWTIFRSWRRNTRRKCARSDANESVCIGSTERRIRCWWMSSAGRESSRPWPNGRPSFPSFETITDFSICRLVFMWHII